MDTPTNGVQGERNDDIEVEKELPTWVPHEDNPQNPDLENIFDGPWDRDWDQFEINETLFGKKSNFDEELYTSKFVRGPEMGQLKQEAMRRARKTEQEETQDLHLAEGRGIDKSENSDIDKETWLLSDSPGESLDNTGGEEKKDIGSDACSAETIGASDSPYGRSSELSGGDSNDVAKIYFGSSPVGVPQPSPSSSEVTNKSPSCLIDHAEQLDSEVTSKSLSAVDVESRNNTIREHNKQVEEMPAPKSGEVEKELAIDDVQPVLQILELENIFAGSWDRGWEKFELNETLFGVKSNFIDQLYTNKLVRGPEVRHLEKKAMRKERGIACKETQGLHIAEGRGIEIRENLDIDKENQVSSVRRGKSLDKNQSEEEEDIPLDSCNSELTGGKSDDGAMILSSSSPVERGIDMRANFDLDKEIQASSVSRGKSLGINRQVEEEDIPLDSRYAETVDAYDNPSGRSTQWSGGKSNDGANLSSCSSPLKSVGYGDINDSETQFTSFHSKSRKTRPSAGSYGTQSPRSSNCSGGENNDGARISSFSSPVQSSIIYEDVNDPEAQFTLVSRKSREARPSTWSAGKNNKGSRISSTSSLVKRGSRRGIFNNQETRFSCVSRGKSHVANTLAGGYGTNSPRSTRLSGGKINSGAKIASGSSSVISLPSLNLKKDSSDKGELFSNVAAPSKASHGKPEVLKSIGGFDPPASSSASSSAVMGAASSETDSIPLIEAPPSKASHGEPEVLMSIGGSEPPASSGASSSAVMCAASSETDSIPLIEAPPSKASHGEPEVLKSIGRSDPPAASDASSSAVMGAASSEKFTLNPNAQVFELNPNANCSTPSESPVSDGATCFSTDMIAASPGIGIVEPFAGNQSFVFPQMQHAHFYPPLYAHALVPQMQQSPPQPYYAPHQFQEMQPIPQVYFFPPPMRSPPQAYVPEQYLQIVQGQYYGSESSTGSGTVSRPPPYPLGPRHG